MWTHAFVFGRWKKTGLRKCWAVVTVRTLPTVTSDQREPFSCWEVKQARDRVRLTNCPNQKNCCRHNNLLANFCSMILIKLSLLVVHSSGLYNGTPHITVSGSTMNPSTSPDSMMPRPFRLESLEVPVSNGKVKRKKIKSHTPDGL